VAGRRAEPLTFAFPKRVIPNLGVQAYWMPPTIPLRETFERVMRPTDSGRYAQRAAVAAGANDLAQLRALVASPPDPQHHQGADNSRYVQHQKRMRVT
jgi:hypothetical protein